MERQQLFKQQNFDMAQPPNGPPPYGQVPQQPRMQMGPGNRMMNQGFMGRMPQPQGQPGMIGGQAQGTYNENK